MGENFGAYKQRLRMFTVHCSEMAEPVKLMHLGYTFQMHIVQQALHCSETISNTAVDRLYRNIIIFNKRMFHTRIMQ